MKQIEKEEVGEILNIDINAASLVKPIKGLSISVHFSYLEARRKHWNPRSNTVRYLISIYLGEALSRKKGKTIAPFTIEAKTDPDVASFTLRGDAYIEGLPEDIEAWVLPDGDKAPRIWMRIYQEAMTMLTVLARFVDAPPPDTSSSSE